MVAQQLALNLSMKQSFTCSLLTGNCHLTTYKDFFELGKNSSVSI